jgi:hypothetical protein
LAVITKPSPAHCSCFIPVGRHVTNKNRELLNRIRLAQGDDIGKASVGPVNAREETAKAYDIWALQHLDMYEHRADPTPPLPEVSKLAFAACEVEQTQPPVGGFAFMLQWEPLLPCVVMLILVNPCGATCH